MNVAKKIEEGCVVLFCFVFIFFVKKNRVNTNFVPQPYYRIMELNLPKLAGLGHQSRSLRRRRELTMSTWFYISMEAVTLLAMDGTTTRDS